MSILTGESEPVLSPTKCTNPQNFLESRNLAFMGTLVVEGSGIGIVRKTGNRTFMGEITQSASAQKKIKTSTGLGLEIRRFVIVIACLACFTGGMCVVVWAAWLRTSYPGMSDTSTC